MSQNPLSASEPWNLVADGYAETTMLVFEQFADEAIAASKLKPNSTVLDVACGPGTLALRLAHHAAQVHGIDFSEAMLAVFRNKIEQAGHRNIALHCGDAQTLPYADATFDAAFSLFGLMFFPDRKRGFAEIYRTLKPGGSIAITSWAPVDQSPAMQTMFGALRAIKPDLPQPQRSVTTLENPERFKQEMEEAGFRNIEIRSVTEAFPVGTPAEFWDNMVKGSAPIQMMKKSIMSVRGEISVRGEPDGTTSHSTKLASEQVAGYVEPHSENMGEALWREKEKLALAWLEETLPARKGPLTSDAWLGVGVK
jgi:ubiquinone/menaquinone biosynthesis C-methylase UbiE